MSNIKQLHKNGIDFFPLTHEDCVVDDNGETIGNKLNDHLNNHTNGNVDLSDYATKDDLDEKAHITHRHNISEIDGFSGGDVDLSDYATKEDLNKKSDISHNHDGKYSNVSHTHNLSDINGLSIGDLSNLKTTNKSSIVGAINELFDLIKDGEITPPPEPPSVGYDTLNLMYPMPQPHGAIPNGAPSDWKYNSRWENKDKPNGWCAFGGWAQVYRVEGSSFSQNTGVELKDYMVYGWKNNQWHQVTKINNPRGSFYVEDFTNDSHSSFPNDIKMSNDYSSTIIRLTSSMLLNGKNVCFHPFTSQMDYDVNFEYIYTCVTMRKVKWLDSGVDDRESAKYCASCGGDWWREPGLQWAPDWSNNKGIAQPKIMEVTNDWKKFSMTTVPESWSNGFPI